LRSVYQLFFIADNLAMEAMEINGWHEGKQLRHSMDSRIIIDIANETMPAIADIRGERTEENARK
jgi:hypothetical protein